MVKTKLHLKIISCTSFMLSFSVLGPDRQTNVLENSYGGTLMISLDGAIKKKYYTSEKKELICLLEVKTLQGQMFIDIFLCNN